MEIYNITRQVVLAQEVQVALRFSKRLKGLLGERSLPVGKGLLLKPCNAVHSWFMSFPFDVVFLDENLVIVYIIEALPPFRFSPVIREARAVLELPAGIVRWSESRVGDRLSLRARFS